MASEGSSLSSAVALVNIGPAGSKPAGQAKLTGPSAARSCRRLVALNALLLFTCYASNLPFQVGSDEPGQVSPQTDAHQVDGAQRRSLLLHTHQARSASSPGGLGWVWESLLTCMARMKPVRLCAACLV